MPRWLWSRESSSWRRRSFSSVALCIFCRVTCGEDEKDVDTPPAAPLRGSSASRSQPRRLLASASATRCSCVAKPRVAAAPSFAFACRASASCTLSFAAGELARRAKMASTTLGRSKTETRTPASSPSASSSATGASRRLGPVARLRARAARSMAASRCNCWPGVSAAFTKSTSLPVRATRTASRATSPRGRKNRGSTRSMRRMCSSESQALTS
mmetsp:Transcript_43690/g.126131  ORF Transcript_43690/g.126131 Transcript_43690/m.126131 type:complete len:214 (+) Transcript_43690:877-1518(+)